MSNKEKHDRIKICHAFLFVILNFSQIIIHQKNTSL